jgi:hypothetical protein
MKQYTARFEGVQGDHLIVSTKNRGNWDPIPIGDGAWAPLRELTQGDYITIDLEYGKVMSLSKAPPRENGGGGGYQGGAPQRFTPPANAPRRAGGGDQWTPEKIKFQAYVNIMSHTGWPSSDVIAAVEQGWQHFHGESHEQPPTFPQPSAYPQTAESEDIPF